MAEQTKLWYLQNFNLFGRLPQDSLRELEAKTGMQSNQKKEIIFFPDEPTQTIYFLKKGKVKISRIAEDGRTTVLQIIGPGEIFGESSLLGNSQHENIAEVIEDAVICSINKDIFTELLMHNSELNLRITRFIGWRLRRIESRVEDLVFKDARSRVTSFLVRYMKKFGKKLVDGWVVRPFLSQQDVADLTAVTRQTASQILNQLKQEGRIDFSRKYLQIPDIETLLK